MNRYLPVILSVLFVDLVYGQGLINNGARIVITSGSNIYIDGSTGNYTNQGVGLVTNSTSGGTITLLGNWINNAGNVAFSNDGSTIVLSGSNQTIGGSGSTTFYNLSLNGTGTKTLNINTSVGGISSFTGVLNLGSRPLVLGGNQLTITNPSSTGISYTTGYIQSEDNTSFNNSIVLWNMSTSTGSHSYPFGISGIQIPFTFNKTTAGAANISVSTRNTVTSDNAPWASASNVGAVTHMYDPTLGQDGSDEAVIDRWWDITTSAPVTANLVFSYRGVENTMDPAYQTGLLGAQHWDGTIWEAPVGSGTGVTAGVGTVSVTGANSFSPWVLSSSQAPLPIELLYLDAVCENDKMVIKWATSSESDNDYFTLEKSMDGYSYSSIAIVGGSGNSSTLQNYSYIDKELTSGMVYYRLKQTDYNGKFSYSSIVSSKGCGETGQWIYTVAKDGQVNVYFSSLKDETQSLDLYDVSGRLVCRQVYNAHIGSNSTGLNVSHLSAGVYLLKISSKFSTRSSKVMIQN